MTCRAIGNFFAHCVKKLTPSGRVTNDQRWWVFGAVLVAYAILTVAVVVGSPLDSLDHRAATMDLARHWPDAKPWVLRYVTLGQRAPSALAAGLIVAFLSWRRRTPRPLVMLATALLLLNVSVGAVKISIGRLGPLITTHPRAVFEGGDIFPSGHTSNAVVVFGVLALLTTARYRRVAIALAVFFATTIGLSTVFLDTHWVTDVLGGWLAGALILLILPEATDIAMRAVIWCAARWRTWRFFRRLPRAGEWHDAPPRRRQLAEK
ncbi:MAG: phosphatase PAP2 family protein [Acidothermus sp.]|nr:phosphatase PAP2 family protein [Acidothermus sp.]MCL6538867.1 phosphatase PAP2 family protein [Acidothermus sp.]